MASKDRERQLARAHYERQQQRRSAERDRRRQRNRITAVLTSLAVVIAAVVLVVLVQGGDDGSVTTQPSPSATPSVATTPSATPSAAVSPCPTAAPVPVASPSSYASAADQELGSAPVTATLTTNCGAITVSLDTAKAPKTVNSFVFLARQKFFDKTVCHRLTTAGLFVLQCGDPTGTGTGSPGYTIPLENAPKDGTYPAGTLAMARGSATDSGGSQFFIVYKATELPGDGYSIFGRVTSGLDVVTREAAAGAEGTTGDGAPLRAIGLTSVAVAGAKASS